MLKISNIENSPNNQGPAGSQTQYTPSVCTVYKHMYMYMCLYIQVLVYVLASTWLQWGTWLPPSPDLAASVERERTMSITCQRESLLI